MIIGAHESIAGGTELVFARAREHGDDCLQIFTRNQQQWRAKPVSDEEAAAFHEESARLGYPLEEVLVHNSYLINLGSSDKEKRKKSIAAMLEEVQRCEKLGLRLLNLHPGSHAGKGEADGLAWIVESFNELLEKTARSPVIYVLEITAGQGSSLGYRFEHMRTIIDGASDPSRFAVCLDTAHTLAAGYDFRTEKGYEEVMAEFDAVIGLDRLVAFHLNDSKKPIGSRVDRHEEIGKGYVGETAFRCLMNDPRHEKTIGVLELPLDVVPANLELLRSFRENKKPGVKKNTKSPAPAKKAGKKKTASPRKRKGKG